MYVRGKPQATAVPGFLIKILTLVFYVALGIKHKLLEEKYERITTTNCYNSSMQFAALCFARKRADR